MRNICTHSWCLFLYGILFCIALHITWKPRHIEGKHKICANYIYTISFSFSLLYNLSSFYQCLHFVWHLVMYKLLTKILLSPSFCLKRSIPYKSKVYFISKVYLNYTPSILEVTWIILQVYFKYTLTCWITEKEVYFKSILFRQMKYIWNTFCEIKSVFLM